MMRYLESTLKARNLELELRNIFTFNHVILGR